MRKTAVLRTAAVALAAVLACVALAVGAGRSAAQTAGSGSPARPWLGVYTQDVGPELREALDLGDESGALVTRVVAGSPAERAGFKRRDYVIRFNDRKLDDAPALASLVSGARVGQTVSLVVIREGTRRTLSVRLAERPANLEEQGAPETQEEKSLEKEEGGEPEAPVPDMGTWHMEMPEIEGLGNDVRVLLRGAGVRGRLGVRIEDLNPDLGEYFGVRDGKGALVLEVTEDTPAARAGIKAGDVIVGVGEDKVTDAAGLQRALRGKEGTVRVALVRKGQRMSVEAKLAAPSAYTFRSAPGRMRVETLQPEETRQLREQLRQLREELRQLRERLDRLQPEKE
jgi:S1-C subfamily serine protease